MVLLSKGRFRLPMVSVCRDAAGTTKVVITAAACCARRRGRILAYWLGPVFSTVLAAGADPCFREQRIAPRFAATPARSAGTAGYPASREGENMFSPRSKTAGAGPSGFGSARDVPLALPRWTLRKCNLNRGAPPRLQRCRSFSSASSHRTRAWRQRDRDRLPLWSERSA